VQEKGFISELFLSFQGEGLFVGRLQLFVRLAGCSLGCRYCDTVQARTPPEEFSVADGTIPNPVAAEELVDCAGRFLDGVWGLHSISVTGGEPLEQPRFLASFLTRARSLGTPLYLETNGLHPNAAEKIFPLVDIISLDIKLPSLCGGGDLLERYERILPIALHADTFCKIVVAEGMDRSEFDRAVDLVARHDRRTPLVIQPATPVDGCGTVAPDLLETLYRAAAERLEDVRVIPQCHHIIGIR
jgi:7-carboxy-7-deazaguanine synthase